MHARDIGKSYRGLTGWVCLGKDRPQAEFESLLERDYYILRSADPTIAVIHHQPVTIEFEHEGKKRSYTPDALLEHHPDPDGQPRRHRLEEVKYTRELGERADELAPIFEAARAYAEEQGWDFGVVTETDIRGVLLDNVELLRNYDRVGNDVDLEIAKTLTGRLQGGQLTIRAMIAGVPERIRGDAIRQAWILLAQGMLKTDMTRPLNRDSAVSLGAHPLSLTPAGS